MQNVVGKILGVSPAWFISLYGTSFSCSHIEMEILRIKDLGFNALQLEVFEESAFEDWRNGGLVQILDRLKKEKMAVSAFVAHFLGNCFSSSGNLAGAAGENRMGEMLDLLECLDHSAPLAVPLLPFKTGPEEGQDRMPDFCGQAAEILERWADDTACRGRELILEIVPGSLAKSYSLFLGDPVWSRLYEKTGFLLDTGHAHVTGECLPELAEGMGKRLKALHISDNGGTENLSLPPGEGSVNWRDFLNALDKAGYSGSLDLEILAPAEAARGKYQKGKEYLSELLREPLLN